MSFESLIARLEHDGHRRLVVLSGGDAWTQAQALHLSNTLPGDWLRVEQGSAKGLSNLLGREFQHAIFDARDGFDVSAFAALSGTLRAGSLLVLMVPPLSVWPERVDRDSVRWSDSAEPIPTPHFVRHFCRVLLSDPAVILWQQHQLLHFPELPETPAWHPANGEPQQEQAAILAALLQSEPGIAVVTAPRGRGKSALAGMLIRHLEGQTLVTAPAKAATEVIARFAGDKYRFIAPDALLAGDEQGGWLVVDEAAAIPGPVLEKLVSRFERVLLTTTVQGYEGTGRGFLLKFCARFSHLKHFTLSAPIRWASGCPLERAVAQALLFDDDVAGCTSAQKPEIAPLASQAWETDPRRAEQVYRLLCSAHYRTSPLDLRRMMDAPGQHFALAQAESEVVGAIWRVNEGGLSPALSRAVWAGYRRPRGNLVAQSLAAHGGSPLAATLCGQRVTRVAVHPARQREGIGQALVNDAWRYSTLDYLSVSFGYTEELWRFWQRCGFILARVGSHREASSGCFTAMALRPISEAGTALCEQEHRRLCRDARIIARSNGEKIPVTDGWESTLNSDDWLELAGFAFAHRPFSTSVAAIARLLLNVALPLPALRGKIEAGEAGRKALLARQREEVAQALAWLDEQHAMQLKDVVLQWQFFQ